MLYQFADFKNNPYIQQALPPLNIVQPNWKTLAVSASREVDIPRERIWEAWTQLERWPQWSALHTSARWLKGNQWQAGAQFEQTLNLGFPLGSMTMTETVGSITPGQRVSWWKDEKGVRSNHVWTFETLADGRTRITNLEIFHGASIGLIKPLVARRWQRLFEDSVNRLIEQVQA